MSLPLKSIHLRLDPDAHSTLAAMADLRGVDDAELARVAVMEWLFGQSHAVKVAASNLVRAGFVGKDGA